MSALHPTRRRLLSGITAGAVSVLAGCLGNFSDETAVEEEVDDAIGSPPPEATTDFQVRSLRTPVDEPFVGFGADDTDDVDDERSRRHRHREFVLSEEQAAAIEFDAVDVDPEARTDVRSFLEETDYETASVVVHQRPIEACYTRRIQYVTVREDRYYIRFCRRLKPAMTPCEADETELEALFVRVPYAYETPPSSRGSGERSQCRPGRAGGERA